MDSTFDALEFLEYLRTRWATVLAACCVAVALAFAASLVLPKRYMSTATILIEPPAGNDPRATTAMSPVYLESLKTYERFALSGSLFARALEHVNPGAAGIKGSADSLRKTVLKVSKPTGTNILEISATWKDPVRAQALAQFIAEQTVSLSRSLDEQAQNDLRKEFRTQFEAARTRLAAARQSLDAFAAAEPAETLVNDVRDRSELKFRLERDLDLARTDLADYTAQLEAMHSNPETADEVADINRRVASARARVRVIEDQQRETGDVLAKEASQLERQNNRRAALEAEVRSAQGAFETANTRLNEILSSSQFHGERLQIIDPGVVPQQPAFPNIPLNLFGALIFAAAGSLVWLGCRFSYTRLVSARLAGNRFGNEEAERLYSFR